MSEVRTNIQISGDSLKYRSNISISVVTLDNNLIDSKSSFRTDLHISTKLSDGNTSEIKTNLELSNTNLTFDLVDMTKLNQTVLYFSKLINLDFEEDVLWELLNQGTDEQINSSHIAEALSPYIKEEKIAPIIANTDKNITTVNNTLHSHINNSIKHLTDDEKSFLSSLMTNPPEINTSEDSFWIEDKNGDLVPKSKEDGTARGVKVKKLYIPNSDGSEIIYQIYVGELGEGANIPSEGGGGTADFSQIKVYDTNDVLLGNGSSSGKITLTPYPVVPTKVSAFENDEGYLKEEDISGLATRVDDIETNITNLGTRADRLQEDIEDVQGDVSDILYDYLSKANGGIIKGAVTIQAALKMNTLYLPNSNNTPSDYTLSIGTLGSGADTPEGGGSGIAQVTIKVNDESYKSNASGEVTLPNYPIVPTWNTLEGKPATLAGYGITDALPLSGGTIRAYNAFPLTIKTSTSSNLLTFIADDSTERTIIGYYASSTRGSEFRNATSGSYIGITDAGVPHYNGNTLLHSGNIGSQSVNYANSAGVLKLVPNQNPDTSSIGQIFTTSHNEGIPSGGYGYLSGITLASNNDANYKVQLGLDFYGIVFSRWQNGGTWTDWNRLAFITDNVASATKLQTARTIWGQSFDGTGNVDGKIYQDGKWIIGLHPDNNLYIGFDTKGIGNTLIFGNEVQTYDSNGNVTAIIKYNGNVLIGTATDYGEKLQVNGTCSITGRTYNPTIHTSDNLAEYTADGEIYGTIKITLPTSWNNDMAIYEIWVYDYTSDAGSKILVSGYTYTGGYWYNARYAVWGSYYKGVRLAHDGSNLCILLGSTGTYWSYPKVYLKARTHGHSGVHYIRSEGYSISLITNESSFSNIQDVSISDTYTYNITAYGNISASGYQLPTSAPSNPVSGGYYLYVGSLGSGAVIS
jgi:hypothetical protein